MIPPSPPPPQHTHLLFLLMQYGKWSRNCKRWSRSYYQSIYMFICIQVSTGVQMHSSMYIWIYGYIRVCLYLCMCIFIDMCKHACKYVYTCMCAWCLYLWMHLCLVHIFCMHKCMAGWVNTRLYERIHAYLFVNQQKYPYINIPWYRSAHF